MISWPALLQNAATNTGIQLQLLPLAEYNLLLAEGANSATFLQGQCTCDIRELANNQWRLGAHCNPKGRMHSSFVAVQLNEDLIGLRLHNSINEPAVAALKKYAIFSKVSVSISNEYAIFALTGPEAELRKTLSETFAFTGDITPGHCHKISGGAILVHDASRVEIWLHENQISSALATLLSRVTALSAHSGQNAWTSKMISAGQCEVRAQTQEQLIPQEMNFQWVDGISFKKGCYTGQEIVARMHYRAQLKKHMYRATLMSDQKIENPLPMTSLINGENKTVGQCLLSAINEQNKIEILALVNDEAVQQQNVILDIETRPILSWLPLPYAIN